MNIRCASYLFGEGGSNVAAMGWFAVMAQPFIHKLHHTTRCTADSLPASQSCYLGGFHLLLDRNAYLRPTSSPLSDLQLEMTITRVKLSRWRLLKEKKEFLPSR